MDKLPDIVLLEIFEKLYYSDLCICSQVCHRWYTAAQSLRLKKKIIVKKHLKHWQLPLLVKYHFHKHLEVFEFWNDGNLSLVPVKKQTFFKLEAKCPRMRRLVLSACSLANITIEDMPGSLEELSVRKSEINPYQFFTPSCQIFMPCLRCLDFGGVSNFLTSADLHIFTRLKSIRCLFLEGCFRINDAGIESITETLSCLNILDIEGTDISGDSVDVILSYGSQIKELYMGYTVIDDTSFQGENLGKLEKLKILCLRNTRVTSHKIKEISNYRSSVNILSNFDSLNSDTSNVSEKTALDISIGCEHYLSHTCSS